MRILYFHQHFTTRDGAAGTRSYEMAQRLIARGHAVTMVCGSYTGGDTGLDGEPVAGIRRGQVDGIDVVELCLPYSNADGFLKRSGTFLRFAVRSVALALSEPHDLLFATTTPLTAGIPGIVTRGLRRRPFVFEVRDLWPELPREMGVIRNPLVLKALEGLEWSSYHAADACIGLSPGIVAGIQRRGIPAEHIAMVPNGCDLALFRPGSGDRPALPGVAPGDLVALFTGAHGLANGLDAVLDAASELKAQGRDDIKLVFIGEGKVKPGLQARAEREGLDNCVFLPAMPKRKLAEVVAGADVGLMVLANVPAFYYGTSPNKFFDYLASGLPVLNNYPGWLSELIVEHGCGLAVPPGDADAFAQALIRLKDHPAERRQMAAQARHLAETRFDRQALADRFVDWLERTHRRYQLAHRPGMGLKRALDVTASLAGLIALSPLLLAIAGAIRLGMGGPAVFAQERAGRDGVPFRIYKFRSMNDTRDANGQLLPDAERLTPLGRFLRKTSLDELPQLFNVLKGDMSLVGPRPLHVRYLPRYSPEQSTRHDVPPGITGWAQINGRNALSWEQKFELDAWYAAHWSLGLDLKILLATAAKVLRREGVSAAGEATMSEFWGSERSEGAS